MVLWHGFYPENSKTILKAIEYTKSVVTRHFENIKLEVEIIHHEEIDNEKNETIERLNDLSIFIKETTGKHKNTSSDFLRRTQNEIKSVLKTYLLIINNTLSKIDSPALLKEKMFVEEIINRVDYEKYDGRLYVEYIDIKYEREKHIFISYSTEDKELAGIVNKILVEKYGFKTFLAHETIEVSKYWREEILKHLEVCTGILAIVTDNFINSSWTHQEIGYGIGKGIPIFSLLYTYKKLGFLEAIQGITMNNYSIEDAMDFAYQYI